MRIFSTFFGRMTVLAVFMAISFAMFMYMLLQTGTQVPLIQAKPKTLTLYLDNIDNLVPASQVQIAGIQVGEVLESSATPEGGKVVFKIEPEHWPLHQGLRIRIGQRSLVGETYLELRDGRGAPLADGATLPREAVLPLVTLYDVYDSLDPETRATTSKMLRSFGASTEQTQEGVAATFDGLSALGREGHTAIDAIAAQSQDLRRLAGQTTTLLNALDTGEGQIARLVTGANRVTQATAGQRAAFEETMRLLPTTEARAQEAAVSLHRLSGSLAPVATDLREAAPKLNDALTQLPETTADLRGLMPSARDVLDRAPKTLDRVEAFSGDVRDVIDPARDVLADVNPVVKYIRPYGPDLAAFFANFSAAIKPADEAGRHIIRAMIFINEKSLTAPTSVSAAVYSNPFPKPKVGLEPGPFEGKYPRVERAPR